MIEELLSTLPAATVLESAKPGAVDATGIPLAGLQPVRSVYGRAVLSSARQVQSWLTLGVEADYEFITLDGGITNGQFVQLADGRLFRAVGMRNVRYGWDANPTFYKYPLKETSFE